MRTTIFDASYLVLGLGDVYLGAPCAVPVDPRQRLVTAKYNPARTFTHEGTVGIGGSYMCIYPMDRCGAALAGGRGRGCWGEGGIWDRRPGAAPRLGSSYVGAPPAAQRPAGGTAVCTLRLHL